MTDNRIAELERELFELAPAVDFPPTPDLFAAIADRLHDREPARRRTAWPSWLTVRPLAPIAAAVAALLAVVLAVSPGAREAVASIFRGVPGIRVLIPEEKPEPSGPATTPSQTQPTSSTPSPSFTPAAAEPVIPGTPIALAEVAAKVPFKPRVPSALGTPDLVYLEPRAARGTVTMVWQADAGLPRAAGSIGAVLTEFSPAGGENFPYWQKSRTSLPSTFRPLEVNGGEGGWIEGGHRLDFAIPDRTTWAQTATSRIAANTLIWVQDGITFRLETALPLEKALEIAATIR
jgi:hypothetical protein